MSNEPPGDADSGRPGRSLPSRRRTLLAAGIVLGAVALVWFAVDWRRLLDLLGRADVALVAVGAVAAILGIACWGEAMRLLLPADARRLTRRRGFLIYATGALVRNALPVGYAGSIALLAYVFRREAGLSTDRSLATVSVAELVNAVASVGLGLLGVLLLVGTASSVPVVRWLGAVAAVATAVVVGGGLLIWRRRSTAKRAVHLVATILTRAVGALPGRLGDRLAPDDLEAALEEYYESLAHVSGRRRTVAQALALSLGGWLATIGALYLAGLAVGYRVPVGVALFVVPVGGYATVLPVPGGLGGYELGVAGLLHLLGGADLVTALAATLLFRLCAFWGVIAVGTLASSYLSVDVRDLAPEATDGSGDGASGGPPSDR